MLEKMNRVSKMAGVAALAALSLGGCLRAGKETRERYALRESAFTLIDEGDRLRAEGSPLLALERYNRAARRYESPRAWFQMGRLYEGLERPDEAATAYREALALAPDWREARLAMLALGYEGETPAEAGEIEAAKAWAATHPIERIELGAALPRARGRRRQGRERPGPRCLPRRRRTGCRPRVSCGRCSSGRRAAAKVGRSCRRPRRRLSPPTRT